MSSSNTEINSTQVDSNSLNDSSSQSDSSDCFTDTPYIFNATITVLLSWAILSFCSQILPSTVGGSLSLVLGIFVFIWFKTFGNHLTRQKHLFFDELIILSTQDTNSIKINDCDTPGDGGPERHPVEPISLWNMLFADDQEIEMQKFYKEHYGPVFKRSMRAQKEMEELKRGSIQPSLSTATNSTDKTQQSQSGIEKKEN